MAITQNQQKFLKERLSRIMQSKPGRYKPVEIPDTPAVKAARKTIEAAEKVTAAHSKKIGEATDKRNKDLEKMRGECEKAIYFGDADVALKLLDKFEATEF